MDKNEIRQALYQLSEEEVPEVNLIPEIQKQIKRQQQTPHRIVFSIARAAAIVVMLLTVSAVLAYTVLQNNNLPVSIPQELVTELNMSETIEGMTVTVNGVYADAHRMAVDINTTFDATQTASGELQNISLQTADGIIIPAAFGGGGGGGGGGGSSDEPVIISSAFMSSFDASVLSTEADSIDLILTVDYGYQEIPPMSAGGGGGGGGDGTPPIVSGSGGGGGGSGDESDSNLVPDSEAPDRHYVFEFTVPLLPAREGMVEEASQSINGIEISIQNIRITPSMTILELCTALFADGWMPDVILQTDYTLPEYMQNAPMTVTLDGEIAYPSNGYGIEASNGDENCRRLHIEAPFTAESGELVILVDELFRLSEERSVEDIEADIAYFETRGFELSYEILDMPEHITTDSPAAFVMPLNQTQLVVFTIEDYPETLDLYQAMQYIGMHSFRERIEGDWIFTVHVD